MEIIHSNITDNWDNYHRKYQLPIRYSHLGDIRSPCDFPTDALRMGNETDREMDNRRSINIRGFDREGISISQISLNQFFEICTC